MRKLEVALRQTAARSRRKSCSCAAAVIASERPERQTFHEPIPLGEVHNHIGIRQLEHFGVGVVYADHGRNTNVCASLAMSRIGSVLCIKTHLPAVVVGPTIVHGHDIDEIGVEASRLTSADD